MDEEIEPLDWSLWFQRIEMIANGQLGCVENSLRHASHLMLLAPAPLRRHVGLAIDEERFEALLDCGDFDTAAQHFVAQPGVLTIEPAAGAKAIKAAIECSVLQRRVEACGETIAHAVLDAWSAHLLALREHFDALLASPWTSNVAVLRPVLRCKSRRLVH